MGGVVMELTWGSEERQLRAASQTLYLRVNRLTTHQRTCREGQGEEEDCVPWGSSVMV